MDVESGSGAEIVGQELEYDGRQELRRAKYGWGRGQSWRIYVVLHPRHNYSLLSQLLYVSYCTWRLEPEAGPVASRIPQPYPAASLSCHVSIVVQPVNTRDVSGSKV